MNSEKNMTEQIESKNVASNDIEAQKRASQLLDAKKTKTEKDATKKTSVASVKTRKAVDVSHQEFDINSKEFKKRASYLTRSYQKVSQKDANTLIIDTKTDLSKELCVAINLDYAVSRYIRTNVNAFISSSQYIKNTGNKGASYGDNSRHANDDLVANKCLIKVDKSYMLEHDLSVDMSKYYYKLNLQSAIVKTRIEQLKAQVLSVKA